METNVFGCRGTLQALFQLETFKGSFWNATRGDGSTRQVIKDHGYRVRASGVENKGYGQEGVVFTDLHLSIDNILIQPEYKNSRIFCRHGLALAKRKLVIGLPLYLHSGYVSFDYAFDGDLTPSRIYVIPHRPKIKDWNKFGAYGWYVWDNEERVVDHSSTPPYPDVYIHNDPSKMRYGWYVRAGA